MIYNYVKEMNDIESNVEKIQKDKIDLIFFNNTEYYIGFDGDVAIGFVSFDLNPDSKFDGLFLSDIYVRPTCRKYKMGSELMAFALGRTSNRICFYNLKKNKTSSLFFKSVLSELKDVTKEFKDNLDYSPYNYSEAFVYEK